MIASKELFELLKKHDLTFITGVPCSTYRDFLIYLNSNEKEMQHIRAASEGEAMGVAAGYYLATKKVPLVYMQNSGLGNAVNPLTSLLDKEVYSIPSVLFISWRAEPGKHDEPQHKKMGRIMLDMLDTLEIPVEIASDQLAVLEEQIVRAKKIALYARMPVALIFKQSILAKDQKVAEEKNFMLREEALDMLLEKVGANIVVSSTGKASREIFEIRDRKNQGHQYDFLTVGSLGCTASIGLGIALQVDKKVFVIDGDGSVLMKMGTLATIGHYHPSNLIHILIDNGVHESTGSQPTVSNTIDWVNLFQSVGYRTIVMVKSKEELQSFDPTNLGGPAGIILKVSPGSRENLGRPTATPAENKEQFMKFLSES